MISSTRCCSKPAVVIWIMSSVKARSFSRKRYRKNIRPVNTRASSTIGNIQAAYTNGGACGSRMIASGTSRSASAARMPPGDTRLARSAWRAVEGRAGRDRASPATLLMDRSGSTDPGGLARRLCLPGLGMVAPEVRGASKAAGASPPAAVEMEN